MIAHSLTMSRVHLAVLCAHSFRPDVTVTPRQVGKGAKKGTYTHALVEHWFCGGEVPHPGDLAPADRIEAERWALQAIKWLEPQKSRILKVEFGLRYDAEADTCKPGPRRGFPDYDRVGPTELAGTGDILIRGVDGVLECVDLKTGQKANAHEEQIRAQGLAVARQHRESRVRVGFLFPRLTKCDDPEWIELDEHALDIEAGKLYSLLASIPTAEPVTGDHCNRCDYMASCPGYRAKWEDEHAEPASEASLAAAGYFDDPPDHVVDVQRGGAQ